MNDYDNYIKPSWAPPAKLFGPVWSVLYIIITITFGVVFFKSGNGSWPLYLFIPFLINLVSNFLYAPLQFYWKNYILSTVVIFIVLLSLIWCMISIYPYSKAIFYALIPYLLWVSFATILQLSLKYRTSPQASL